VTDPAIIAAAHRALRSVAFPRELYRLQTGAVVADVDEACAAILTAVTPLIEAAALKRIEELEAALREIKKLGRTRGYGREALAQIAARALKQEAGE